LQLWLKSLQNFKVVAIAEMLFLKKVVAAMAEIPKSFKGTVVANEYG